MCENNQNVKAEIADEQLKGVVGGTQDAGVVNMTIECPHCGASIGVGTGSVNQNIGACPQGGQSITMACLEGIPTVGGNGTRFG